MKRLITICSAIMLLCTGYARAGALTTLDYPGTKITEAYGISGSSIVGTYMDSSGYEHGFIYETPEPATLWLFGFGAVLLRKRRSYCS